MVGIYKFTNKINGKSYIGQSTNIERRHKEHKYRNGENTLFHKAIKEYGFDNFDFSIIEYCSADELNDKEVFYIKKYNTLIPNGYNVSEGGYLGHPVALSSIDEAKNIISLLKNTNMTTSEIGSLYDVTHQTVSAINNGYIWRDDSLTYPIRNRKDISKMYCKICGKELYRYAKNNLCNKCIYEKYKKDAPISKEELFGLLCKNSFTYVGNMFGVSANAVRKWCDKYNIPRHSSYYKELAS